MLSHSSKSKLDYAMREANLPETSAAVVAIHRDNGQIVIYNIGDKDDLDAVYQKLAMVNLADKEDER